MVTVLCWSLYRQYASNGISTLLLYGDVVTGVMMMMSWPEEMIISTSSPWDCTPHTSEWLFCIGTSHTHSLTFRADIHTHTHTIPLNEDGQSRALVRMEWWNNKRVSSERWACLSELLIDVWIRGRKRGNTGGRGREKGAWQALMSPDGFSKCQLESKMAEEKRVCVCVCVWVS